MRTLRIKQPSSMAKWGARRITKPSMLCFWSMTFLAALLSLLPYVGVDATSILDCQHELAAADVNGDNQLDRREFVRLVNAMSGGQYQSMFLYAFKDLPSDLIQTFQLLSCKCLADLNEASSCCSDADATVDISGANSHFPSHLHMTSLQHTCDFIRAAVFAQSEGRIVNPTTRQGRPSVASLYCQVAMALADTTPEDAQLDQPEYVGFVNYLSSNQYSGASFNELPEVIQLNFDAYQVNGTVNIYGASLGEDPTSDQDQFLVDFCTDTNETIAIANGVTPAPTTRSPTPLATSTDPTTAPILPPTREPSRSTTGPPRSPSVVPTQAPTTLKPTIAKSLAPSTGLSSVVPTSTPVTPRPSSVLTSTPETSIPSPAITTTSPSVSSFPSPTQGSDQPTTARPTGSTLQCYVAITVADEDGSGFLNQDEYVIFVNRISDDYYSGYTFDQLPQPLQDNFYDLATPSSIDIRGSKPGSSQTQEQLDSLKNICRRTYVALQAAAAPNSLPSNVPTSPPFFSQTPTSPFTAKPTTVAPSSDSTQAPVSAPIDEQKLEIISEFIISNLQGIRAENLIDTNYNRILLEESYDIMTNDTVTRLYGSEGIVKKTDNSAFAGAFTDVDCPESVTEEIALCQSVTAGFSINAPSNDTSDFLLTITAAVDDDIDSGKLQSIFDEKGSVFTVIPIQSPTSPLTPTSAPSLSLPTVSNFTGSLTIPSAFIISNSVGVTATALGEGSVYRDELLLAFNLMAKDVVNASSENVLRQVPSVAQFIEDSGDFEDVLDISCPDTVSPGFFCQTVFANYEILVKNVESSPTIQEYSRATQGSIQSGDLEVAITTVNPESPFEVLEESVPTRPPSSSNQPTDAPGTVDGDSDGNNANVIAIGVVSGVVGVAFLCCVWYVLRSTRVSKDWPKDYAMGNDSDMGGYTDKYNFRDEEFGNGGHSDGDKGETYNKIYHQGLDDVEAPSTLSRPRPYGLSNTDPSLRLNQVFDLDNDGPAPAAASGALRNNPDVLVNTADAESDSDSGSDSDSDSSSGSDSDSDDSSDSDSDDSSDSDSDSSSGSSSGSNKSEDVPPSRPLPGQFPAGEPSQVTDSSLGMKPVSAAVIGAAAGAGITAAALSRHPPEDTSEGSSSSGSDSDSDSSSSGDSGSSSSDDDSESDSDSGSDSDASEANGGNLSHIDTAPALATKGLHSSVAGSNDASNSTMGTWGHGFGDDAFSIPPVEDREAINPVNAAFFGAGVGAVAAVAATVGNTSEPDSSSGTETSSGSDSDSTSGSDSDSDSTSGSDSDIDDQEQIVTVDKPFGGSWSVNSFAESSYVRSQSSVVEGMAPVQAPVIDTATSGVVASAQGKADSQSSDSSGSDTNSEGSSESDSDSEGSSGSDSSSKSVSASEQENNNAEEASPFGASWAQPSFPSRDFLDESESYIDGEVEGEVPRVQSAALGAVVVGRVGDSAIVAFDNSGSSSESDSGSDSGSESDSDNDETGRALTDASDNSKMVSESNTTLIERPDRKDEGGFIRHASVESSFPGAKPEGNNDEMGPAEGVALGVVAGAGVAGAMAVASRHQYDTSKSSSSSGSGGHGKKVEILPSPADRSSGLAFGVALAVDGNESAAATSDVVFERSMTTTRNGDSSNDGSDTDNKKIGDEPSEVGNVLMIPAGLESARGSDAPVDWRGSSSKMSERGDTNSSSEDDGDSTLKDESDDSDDSSEMSGESFATSSTDDDDSNNLSFPNAGAQFNTISSRRASSLASIKEEDEIQSPLARPDWSFGGIVQTSGKDGDVVHDRILSSIDATTHSARGISEVNRTAADNNYKDIESKEEVSGSDSDSSSEASSDSDSPSETSSNSDSSSEASSDNPDITAVLYGAPSHGPPRNLSSSGGSSTTDLVSSNKRTSKLQPVEDQMNEVGFAKEKSGSSSLYTHSDSLEKNLPSSSQSFPTGAPQTLANLETVYPVEDSLKRSPSVVSGISDASSYVEHGTAELIKPASVQSGPVYKSPWQSSDTFSSAATELGGEAASAASEAAWTIDSTAVFREEGASGVGEQVERGQESTNGSLEKSRQGLHEGVESNPVHPMTKTTVREGLPTHFDSSFVGEDSFNGFPSEMDGSMNLSTALDIEGKNVFQGFDTRQLKIERPSQRSSAVQGTIISDDTISPTSFELKSMERRPSTGETSLTPMKPSTEESAEATRYRKPVANPYHFNGGRDSESNNSSSSGGSSSSGSSNRSEQKIKKANLQRNEKSFRSALDDGDSQVSEEYSSSDETFEEGTQIASLGTFEDTFGNMNPEEALAFAMDKAKRMDDEQGTTIKSADTDEFDRQIAHIESENRVRASIPDMEGTDNSGESSEDDSDDASGESSDTSSSGSSSDSSDTSESGSSSSAEGKTTSASSEDEQTASEDQSFHTAGTAGKGLLHDKTEFRRQLQIRQEVEDLVRELVPEEVENLDAMFVQFAGREEELLSTLHTMRERRAKVRARAAIHKSKARPPPRMNQHLGYRRSVVTGSQDSSSMSGSPTSAQGSNLRPHKTFPSRGGMTSSESNESSMGSASVTTSGASGSSSSETSVSDS